MKKDLASTKNELSLTHVNKINKIIITSNSVSTDNYIDDTCFIDYSALLRFLERDKPCHTIRKRDVSISVPMPGLTEYEGNITANKMNRFLRNPGPVSVVKQSVSTQQDSITFYDSLIEYEYYYIAANKIFYGR